jgi:hypothetical protein
LLVLHLPSKDPASPGVWRGEARWGLEPLSEREIYWPVDALAMEEFKWLYTGIGLLYTVC